jgi:hypothetical protein
MSTLKRNFLQGTGLLSEVNSAGELIARQLQTIKISEHGYGN